jgi:hypothetical protein
MKYSLLLLVVYLCCANAILAQTDANKGGVEMTAGEDLLHARLQLTTNVIGQQYCSNDRLRFTLRLKFTNGGTEPVILDRRSSVVSQYKVSRNLKSAGSKSHEMIGHLLIDIGSAGMSLETSPEESHFVTLNAGESFSLNKMFSLPIRSSTDVGENSLPPGNHLLQIVVLTWYYPNASNVKWRERWRQKGYLWTDSITSLPMPFIVEKKRPIIKCV